MVREHNHPTHSAATAPRLALAALAAALPALLGAACRLRRVRVTGDSMLPAFRDGDRLLVAGPGLCGRSGRWGLPRPGDVVAVLDPRERGRILIKRVHSVDGDRVEVRGDNAPSSTDSRHFGTVPISSVRGRVLYRYAPPDRVRWRPE